MRWGDEHGRRRYGVENGVVGSADALLSVAVHAGNFFRSDQHPLQVAVVIVGLGQVVVLGGVGGPPVPRGGWDVKRDWEFGWLVRRKPGRAGGGRGEGTRRGAPRGRRFLLWEVKRRGRLRTRFGR